MKFLIDMNLSPTWADILEATGFHGSKHWSQAGAPTASDKTILEYARAKSYIVLSHDLDMSAIIASTRAMGPSVVQFRMADILPSISATRVVSVLLEYADVLERGAILTIDDNRSRARILPVRD